MRGDTNVNRSVCGIGVGSLQCQNSVSQTLVSTDSLHHDLYSTVLLHSFILIRGNINGSTCSQHVRSVNMLKRLIVLFVVMVVLALELT